MICPAVHNAIISSDPDNGIHNTDLLKAPFQHRSLLNVNFHEMPDLRNIPAAAVYLFRGKATGFHCLPDRDSVLILMAVQILSIHFSQHTLNSEISCMKPDTFFIIGCQDLHRILRCYLFLYQHLSIYQSAGHTKASVVQSAIHHRIKMRGDHNTLFPLSRQNSTNRSVFLLYCCKADLLHNIIQIISGVHRSLSERKSGHFTFFLGKLCQILKIGLQFFTDPVFPCFILHRFPSSPTIF